MQRHLHVVAAPGDVPGAERHQATDGAERPTDQLGNVGVGSERRLVFGDDVVGEAGADGEEPAHAREDEVVGQKAGIGPALPERRERNGHKLRKLFEKLLRVHARE